MAKYLDQEGLKYFWGKIKAIIPGPLQAYPVGSIYISNSSNFDPNTSFGGTWKRFGQGRTLIGEGTGNDGSTSMSFTASETYGEYQHTLTIHEMPRHDHEVITGTKTTSNPEKYGFYPSRISDTINDSKLAYTRDKGNSSPHNNIQPSIVVFFWERIA